MTDHYSVLGIKETATKDEIRAAFRKSAREYHPDRNPLPEAAEKFLAVKEAYEILSNEERRKIYDSFRKPKAKPAEPKAESTQPKADPPQAKAQQGRGSTATKEEFLRHRRNLEQLEKFASASRWGDATELAEEILRSGKNEPLAYAVLGDAARLKGAYEEAAKQFAFALQFDPSNEIYQKMHVAMLDASKRRKTEVARDLGEKNPMAFFAGVFVIVAAVCYTALSKEPPLMAWFSPISTWGIATWGMLLVSGIAIGVSLSTSDLIDHFDLGGGIAGYRFHPGVLVAVISLFNFWLAAGIYFLVGASQKSFNTSLTRLIVYVMCATVAFGFARFSAGWDAVAQTLIWGGGILYLFGLLGWFVADSMRKI
ncbi:MAG: J domain-containing protein [Fimbriimonadaceae bacterium]|nr:MAG: J domain-containing protein [Fimbriimonadaceae bacterium]